MTKADWPEVAWFCSLSEDYVYEFLRARNSLALVAEINGVIVGMVMYTVTKDSYEIEHICVRHDFRRKGIGRQIIEHMMNKLNDKRHRMVAAPHESEVDAHLFFREMGFKCTSIFEGESVFDSLYVFEFDAHQIFVGEWSPDVLEGDNR